MSVLRTAVVSTAATLALLGGAAPAVAAGAETFRDRDCFTLEDDFGAVVEVCVAFRGIFKVTETPSGNFSVISNGSSSFTATQDGEQVGSGRDKFQFKLLVRKGEVQVEHAQSRGMSKVFGEECSYSFRFHESNGQVRYEEDFDFTCE
jgi:hypothetical protein